MMKRIIIPFTFLFLLMPCMSSAQNISAKEVIKKADEILRGVKSTKAEMTIKIVRPKWSREMKMKSWSKGDDLSMILITTPVKDRGTTFLMRKKEVWNWIPAIDRTIKLPPSMMMQSWMGTDFTNDDLVKQSSIVTDYLHTIVGDSTIDGRECYKLQMIAKEDAPVVWGKILTWVDKKDYLQLYTEFYDEDDELVNVMKASEIKNMGGKLLPTRTEMIPMDKKGQKTVMTYSNLEFDIPIEDSFFSTQKMKRLK